MNPKSLLGSWTFWFGMTQIATAVVGYFGHFLDPQAALALLMTGLTSIGLRMKTSQPIGSILPH